VFECRQGLISSYVDVFIHEQLSSVDPSRAFSLEGRSRSPGRSYSERVGGTRSALRSGTPANGARTPTASSRESHTTNERNDYGPATGIECSRTGDGDASLKLSRADTHLVEEALSTLQGVLTPPDAPASGDETPATEVTPIDKPAKRVPATKKAPRLRR
jgi:hypothetical protein